MTVSNNTARTSAVGTNVAGQEIAFSFPINATSDLTVKSRVTTTGVESTLTETTNYTVTINGDSGGTVTMVAAWANTYTLWVIRNTPRTQTLDLEQGDDFSAENLEIAIDKIVRMLNDLYDKVGRCLHYPDSDATSLSAELPNSVDRASQYASFTATGAPTVVSSVAPATATITAFAETLLDDATQAAMRTTLALTPGTDVQAYDADLLAIGALAKTDGNIIVGNGTTWVAESGATARTSLGVPAATDTPLISKILVSMRTGEILNSYRTGQILVQV
jgi:hypothetical protein